MEFESNRKQEAQLSLRNSPSSYTSHHRDNNRLNSQQQHKQMVTCWTKQSLSKIPKIFGAGEEFEGMWSVQVAKIVKSCS